MIGLYVLLFGTTLLAMFYNSKFAVQKRENILSAGYKENYTTVNMQNAIVAFAVFAILSIFCGLRTIFNDTRGYITGYLKLPRFSETVFTEQGNIGFLLYQHILKDVFSVNVHVFVLISSIIPVFFIIRFCCKYSENFAIAVFIFVTCGLYVGFFGAMKQSLSIAFLFWSVDFLLNKKYIRFTALVLIASTFHMFAILFLMTPFLLNKAYNKGIYIFFGVTITAGIFFNKFIEMFFNILEIFTDKYTEEVLVEYEGLGIMRLLVSAVMPIIAFVFIKKIREKNDKVLNLAINMTAVCFFFNIIAFFGNPILFGRLAFYFMPFYLISFPYILLKIIPYRYRYIVLFSFILLYSIYYYNLFYKYFIVFGNTIADIFRPINFFDLFKNTTDL
ncbi:hypothetical protein AGMMS50284_0100 [Clostridia bacterium]|nr:hypothetical protein AGMMS50284_0100 [Clostridia bacterium]